MSILEQLQKYINEDVSSFINADDTTLIDKVKTIIHSPYVKAQISTLGGPERASLTIWTSLQPKEQWTNNIYHNSPYAIFHVWHDGSMDATAQYTMPKFRKTRVKSVDDALNKINAYLEIAKQTTQS